MKNRKAHEKQERTRKTGKDVKNRKGYEKQEKIRKHLKMFSICVKLLLLLPSEVVYTIAYSYTTANE
jgi:hypothetical protein